MITDVLILGANGQLARHATALFLNHPEVRLTLYRRRASRLQNPDPDRASIVEGDVTDLAALTAVMREQDVVYASLACQVARQAGTSVDATPCTPAG